MSAFILSKNHIDTLVQFVFICDINPEVFWKNEWHKLSLDRMGQCLITQNHRSVHEHHNEMNDIPTYKFNSIGGIMINSNNLSDNPVDILKACDCYDYQSSETKDYYETLACAIIKFIRHKAISRLDGYDEAPWSID